MKTVLFDDKIILYWTYDSAVVDGAFYRVEQDGEIVLKTDKTHFSATGLAADTDYRFSVALCIENGSEKMLYSGVLRTAKKKQRIDVTQMPYGAVGDGKTLCTTALQMAMDACTENDTVYFPAGTYLSGSLRLHSNTDVYLDEGAVLKGTENVDDYKPKIHSRFEGIEMDCYSALINMGTLNHDGGYSCSNVTLRGKGKIYGGGRPLAENVITVERELLRSYIECLGEAVKECENENTIPGRPRPRLINMSNAENIVIDGLHLGHGASWNVHFIYSRNIVTSGCVIHSENVWNGDGWDPDSSTDCAIFDCDFYTGDDGIAIKSGKNPEGNIINRPSERISVFDCRSHSGHGMTIGSEMSGGINDIHIWDCDLSESYFGMEIKGTKKRGGYVRNVVVDRCSMPRIMMHAVGYNDDGVGAKEPPIFEKCTFNHLTLSGISKRITGEENRCDSITLIGFDGEKHALADIAFNKIHFTALPDGSSQKILIRMVRGLTLNDLECD